MRLDLVRYITHHSTSTLGMLFLEDDFQCYTLENPFRFAKMEGESCIPEGEYRIKKREVLSKMTKKYRQKYKFFDWHLELQDVPDFQYIYLHVGNQRTATDGCILVGETQDYVNKFIGRSTQAYEKLYKAISEALDNEEEVTIKVQYLRL